MDVVLPMTRHPYAIGKVKGDEGKVTFHAYCSRCDTTRAVTNVRPWPDAGCYIGECPVCGNTLAEKVSVSAT